MNPLRDELIATFLDVSLPAVTLVSTIPIRSRRAIEMAGVSEILRVPDESVDPTPPMVTSGTSAEFIRGVAKVKERLIIVLDLDRIFSSEERELLSQSAV
jgi:chemotaxis signal transduction protein